MNIIKKIQLTFLFWLYNKYSLSGFSAGYDKLFNGWSDWVDNNKNPFDSKNPFRN